MHFAVTKTIRFKRLITNCSTVLLLLKLKARLYSVSFLPWTESDLGHVPELWLKRIKILNNFNSSYLKSRILCTLFKFRIFLKVMDSCTGYTQIKRFPHLPKNLILPVNKKDNWVFKLNHLWSVNFTFKR